MALRTLTELVERAREKFGILELSIGHRAGRVPVGGDSVVIACAAAHRSEAFAACSWVMEEVKRIVPIWKTEAGTAERPLSATKALRKSDECGREDHCE